MSRHLHSDAGTAGDFLMPSLTGVFSGTSMASEQPDGQTLKSGASTRGVFMADSSMILVISEIASVMSHALNGPVSPTEIEELLRRGLLGITTADQVEITFFLSLIFEIKAFAMEENQLLTKGKPDAFTMDGQGLDFTLIQTSVSFLCLNSLRGKRSSVAGALRQFEAWWVD